MTHEGGRGIASIDYYITGYVSVQLPVAYPGFEEWRFQSQRIILLPSLAIDSIIEVSFSR